MEGKRVVILGAVLLIMLPGQVGALDSARTFSSHQSQDVVADHSPTERVTLSGAVIPIGEKWTKQAKETVKNATRGYAVDRLNVMLMWTESSRCWVFTDRDPQVAEAEVSGEKLSIGSDCFVIANSVQFDTTPTQISYSEFMSNTEEYNHELVRITTEYQQLPVASDSNSADIHVPMPYGVGYDSANSRKRLPHPGRVSRASTINANENQYWSSSLQPSTELLSNQSVENAFGVWSQRKQAFFVNGTTSVTGIAFTHGPYSNRDSDAQAIVPRSVQPQGTSIDDVSEIHERGDSLEGTTVTFTADLVGGKISTKEVLLEASSCGKDSVQTSNSGCVPVYATQTIHTGVLVDGLPTSITDTIPYVALSNKPVGDVYSREKGRYRVVGRVVSTDQIDPRLPDGYALIVYDMERVGDLTLSDDAVSESREFAEQMRSHLRSQLTATDSEWSEIQEEAQKTATPTATPTVTSTSTLAASPDDQSTSSSTKDSNDKKPTETQIQDSDGDGVIDSQDYAPRDPDVQEKEDAQSGTEVPGFNVTGAVIALLCMSLFFYRYGID